MATAPAPNAAQQARMMLASNSILGRFQGPELFYSQSVDLSTPSTVNIPRVLNLTRPLESLIIKLAFRATVTVANYTAVSPEAPQNILQQIQVTGIHRAFGQLTPIRMTGATEFVRANLYQPRASKVLINGALAASPTQPMTSPFAGTTAGSPYDIIVVYNIPTGPSMGIGQSLKRQSTAFLWMPQDWADSIQIQLNLGDASALGDPTGATVAFTAYGSGTGLPTLAVHANYAILGQLQSSVNAGVFLRSEQSLTGFTALQNAARLSVLQKSITPNIIVKSGLIETDGQSPGITTFASLSDLLLDRTQVQVDNKPIRNNQDNVVSKGYLERMYAIQEAQGYYLISFTDGQNALLAYRGDGLPAGSQFELISDVVTASGDNRLSFVQEQIYGGPFPGLRP